MAAAAPEAVAAATDRAGTLHPTALPEARRRRRRTTLNSPPSTPRPLLRTQTACTRSSDGTERAHPRSRWRALLVAASPSLPRTLAALVAVLVFVLAPSPCPTTRSEPGLGSLFGPRAALADTSQNDAEVEILVQSVFESEYPKKHYVEALENLQLAATVCQEGSCSAKTRAKVLVAVATVLAGGLQQKQDAIEVFKIALKEDPRVGLVKGFDKGPIKEAWEAARGKGPSGPAEPAEIERKKYPGGFRAPRGWKTAEGWWYYNEAQKAQSDRAWALCNGYAGDSFQVENRVGTRFIRAQCGERAGKWVDAINDYEVVAREAPSIGMRDTGKTAKERLDDLTARVPKLVLRPPANYEELTVELDGEPVAKDRLGGEIWVDPGQRRIVADGTIGGKQLSFERDVTLEEGKSVAVDIKLVPAESRVYDNRILKCLEQSKSREELAACIGEGVGQPTNVLVGMEVSGYTDTDNTDVITPGVFTTITNPTDGWTLGGSFLVDVVTTASTDIVATASPRWTEVRYVPALNGSKKFGDMTFGLRGGASIESDYTSGSAGLSWSMDLLDKRVTPTLVYEFSYDVQGRAGTSFSTFSSDIIRNSVDGGVSIVVDKATVFTASITAVFENGDQSKPYRYLPLFDPEVVPLLPPGLSRETVDEVRQPERVREQLPLDRQRFALAGRIAHRFESSTIRADQRVYTDSWGVLASTTDAKYFIDLDDRFRVWPHLRFHAQTGASFWQIGYESIRTPQGIQVRDIRTGDRELGPMLGTTAGAGGRVALGEHKTVALILTADMVYTRFLDHLFILERLAFFSALGAEVEFE